MLRTNYKYLFAGFLALILTACGGADADSPEAKKSLLDEKKKQLTTLKAEIETLEKELSALDPADPKDKLRRIGVMALSTENFEHFIEVQGEVTSDKNVEVRPDIAGTVINRFVEEGQWVNAGQVLAEIDADLVKRNIEEVKTRLSFAETLYNRQKNLREQNIGSEIQFLEAKNNKESLERNLETLQTQLDKAKVKSPISGTVDQFFLNPGEMANPNMPIARVVNLNQVEVSAEVSEAYTQEVKRGEKVLVKFPALDLDVPAKIDVVGQFINPKNRSFRIEIKLDNREMQVKPNTMTLVRIKDFEQENAVVIPSHLIQKSTSGEKFIFIAEKAADKTIARKVSIEIGKSYKGKTLIKNGLAANAKIITEGYNEVVDGEEVNIVKEASSKDSNMAAN